MSDARLGLVEISGELAEVGLLASGVLPALVPRVEGEGDEDAGDDDQELGREPPYARPPVDRGSRGDRRGGRLGSLSEGIWVIGSRAA